MKCSHYYHQRFLTSGNQTWLPRKTTIWLDDFPTKLSIYRKIPHMFPWFSYDYPICFIHFPWFPTGSHEFPIVDGGFPTKNHEKKSPADGFFDLATFISSSSAMAACFCRAWRIEMVMFDRQMHQTGRFCYSYYSYYSYFRIMNFLICHSPAITGIHRGE